MPQRRSHPRSTTRTRSHTAGWSRWCGWPSGAVCPRWPRAHPTAALEGRHPGAFPAAKVMSLVGSAQGCSVSQAAKVSAVRSGSTSTTRSNGDTAGAGGRDSGRERSGHRCEARTGGRTPGRDRPALSLRRPWPSPCARPRDREPAATTRSFSPLRRACPSRSPCCCSSSSSRPRTSGAPSRYWWRHPLWRR